MLINLESTFWTQTDRALCGRVEMAEKGPK